MRRGFTLVELLVAIAIIALLIAIMIPVLGHSRDTGRNVVCQNNQKQLAYTTMIFAVENKGRMVWPNYPEGSIDHFAGWLNDPAKVTIASVAAETPDPARLQTLYASGQFASLLSGFAAYRCPLDQPPFPSIAGNPSRAAISYMMNGALCANRGDTGVTFKMEQFKGTDVVFWEPHEWMPGWYGGSGQTGYFWVTSRHFGRGGNLACLDGHARFIADREYQAMTYETPGPLNCTPPASVTTGRGQ